MHRTPLWLLYLNVLVIATCGLIYELLAGTLASYVLGDSVTQFSLVIGVYLFALGAGAWLSGFVKEGLGRAFIEVELAVAILGGFSAPLLYIGFAWVESFRILLFGMVFLIGTMVGLELPLLMRILKEHLDFDELVARVLTFDYIGALLASLMFPILLVPRLGLVRTSLIFGLLNALVALWGTSLLRPLLKKNQIAGLKFRSLLVITALVVGLIKADRLTMIAEETIFEHPIVYAESSPFQRIVLTQSPNSFQLWLNGHLQFNSIDEYRYHEALVHPTFAASPRCQRVLVLGGGDGLAVREILRYPEVQSVTLIDLDPAMTSLHERFPPLKKLTNDSLSDPRVTVINDDAYLWAGRAPDNPPFDLVLIDFPDPNSYSVGKLYTSKFYKSLRQHLAADAMVSVQCTSPLIAPQSYWCILKTMESVGFHVRPYSTSVPSFGIWGYALASPTPFEPPATLAPEIATQLRFLNNQTLSTLFELTNDLQPREVEINRLDSQVLVRYYESEWRTWN